MELLLLVVVGEQGWRQDAGVPSMGRRAASASCLQVLPVPQRGPLPGHPASRGPGLLHPRWMLTLGSPFFLQTLSRLAGSSRFNISVLRLSGGSGPTAGLWGCSNSPDRETTEEVSAWWCLQSTEDACE